MLSRQHLLLLVSLLLLITPSQEGHGGRAPSKAAAAAALAGCRNSCGDLTFVYPFGVGSGCFRSPDFELICDTTTRPPKLSFRDGVTLVTRSINIVTTEYMGSSTEASVSVAFSDAIYTGNASVVSWSLTPKPIGDSFVSVYLSGLSFFGCGFDVHWLNRPSSGGGTPNCTATCPQGGGGESTAGTVPSAEQSCNGTGCCSIYFGDNTIGYASTVEFRIVRRRDNGRESRHRQSSLRDTIYVTDIFDQQTISWKIVDQPDCPSARKHRTSYACVSNKSICVDMGHSHFEQNGYNCRCRSGYTGNPYILDGCSPDNGYNPYQQKTNCTRQCGNISVPFPFGLEEGCYARKQFYLSCTNATSSTLVLDGLGSTYNVTNISVDKGLIEYVSPKTAAETDIYRYADDGLQQSLYVYVSTPVVPVQWFAAHLTCQDAKRNSSGYACVSTHSECITTKASDSYVGYRCKCGQGYQGNPYISNGCVDIDECLEPNVCPEMCNNTVGKYICVPCPHKTEYEPLRRTCIKKHQNLLLGIAIGLSVGFGILLLCLSGVFLIRRWRNNIQKQLRKRYFEKNKGLLLRQLISSNEKPSDNKIFSLEELQKATNNFDRTRILGSGGHGIVYKGILSDQRVVAIKKPKVIKEGEINQFINEVAILSQINHRNIVKLHGCCLETEVPLLVYDFIPNGSLFRMIHADASNEEFLSWSDSIRIATEAAGALCYLHSAASMSVFHRDVKSSNILLDGNYTAKVSDFGASRLIPIDQSHVITNIQGTFGYLDPEYYHTGQLNEKSDVYSFGVVLVELLLRKEAIFINESGSKNNLSNYFLWEIKTRPIREIVASQVREQATEDEINTVASLAQECLRLRGEERPTMKEVEMTLHFLQNKVLRSFNAKESNKERRSMQATRPPHHKYITTDIGNKKNLESSSCYKLEKEFMSSASIPR
ncbi:wall-associated receptor kinase-like 8 [Oryza brachyantha]|uniref:wall-associated receptor kinase-like 8 n=1 Tax=Oryza brachyantha TaxID=4533 RepID=UPI00077616B9|nr:wall-associated receptor kinase-like 8 [Oryza brachyantha]